MRAFPAAAAAAFLLAACAIAPPPGSDTTTPTPTPSASPSSNWLSEEPVVLTVGQPVDLSDTRGLPKTIVTIESIEEKASCPTGAIEPKQGQFVLVTVSAIRQEPNEQFDLAVYDWFTIGIDGQEREAKIKLTQTDGSEMLVDATGLCYDEADRLSLNYDSVGQVHGVVLLDAPAALGSILLRNGLVNPPVTITIEMPPR